LQILNSMKKHLSLLIGLLFISLMALGQSSSINGNFTATAPSNLSLQTGATPITRLTILNANGYIGINTTTPTARLHVVGDQGIVQVETTNTSGYGAINLKNTSSELGQLGITSSGFSNGIFLPQQTYLNSGSLNGLSLAAYNANGFMTFGTGGLSTANERMRIDKYGNIGIGTTTPAYKLDVAGTINSSGILINGVPFAGGGTQWLTNGTSIGYTAGFVGIGTTAPTEALDITGSLRVRTIAQNNALAQILVTDANGKMFWRDVSSIATYSSNGSGNVGIGPGSLAVNAGGGFNTATGFRALHLNTTGGGNTANGCNALLYNTTGLGNNANGAEALYSNSMGNENIANGLRALYNNTTGSYNIANGNTALFTNTIGSNNTANGYRALDSNTTGSYNTANGYNALDYNTTGSYNTADGNYALRDNTTGNYNTALGHQAGVASGSTISNATAIGANAVVNVSDGIVLGTSTSKVGIRNSSPFTALNVQNAYCDGNAWYTASDKNLKENFTRIATEESILTKVMSLPIQYWNYKETNKTRHIGPTAQDFYKTFKLGNNETTIATVDEAGVALAAIQELAQKTEKLEALVKVQQELIASLMKASAEKSVTSSGNNGGLMLYQNAPNPFQGETEIKMYVPESVSQALLYMYDLQGKAVQQIMVQGRGQTNVKLSGGSLPAGLYLYALVGDGNATEAMRMVLTE
jgi:trimeric autotransporter adhesin